ncbi:hypothetical protein ACFL6G_04805 [candidate division KSB1 bacterium]
MKNTNKQNGVITFTAFILILFSIAACNENAYQSEQILKRIPDGDFMVFSAKPKDILNSTFVKTAIEMDIGMDEFLRDIADFEEKMGVNPKEDVERFTVFSDDFKGIEENFGIIAQGNFRDFDLENMIWEMRAEDSLVTIASYEVHMLTDYRRRDEKTGYLYYDENEMIIGANRDFMAKILELKKGTGPNLSNNRDFTAKLNRLKNKNSYWFVVPTNQLIEDVLEKVKERNPQFSGDVLEIEAFLGGFTVGDELKSNFLAYNSREEQLQLLYDLANSAQGLGILTMVEFPELRDILRRVDINKSSDYLEIKGTLTLDDLEMLDDLHGRLPFRRR